jgi:hypothetical protein
MPVFPALMRLRQENHEFNTSLDSIPRPSLIKANTKEFSLFSTF